LDVWGEDFRSDYVTGADFVTPTNDDIEIYQAYIEAADLFGLPLRARIGRQELRFGSEWLVGANDDGPSPAWGLSFDGIRLTYATDLFSVDAWWSKLADRSPAEEDGDVDFYGLYASYYGVQDFTFDAYWLWLRDGISINDTGYTWLSEWIEDAVGVDDYDVTDIHTVGLRAAGTLGAFDVEAEAAYQWGEASIAGTLFSPFTYGDDAAEYSEWACTVELGYTFNVPWQPRVYIGYAFYGGADKRGLSFEDWVNPFDAPEASLSFNRLFSNTSYTYLFDWTDLSNAHVFRAGASAMITESIEIGLDAAYFLADEAFDAPAHFVLGRYRIPIAPSLSFWTQSNDDRLGLDLSLYACYDYSDDLSFEVGWTHLFVGDGLREGSFSNSNGLDFNGGTGGDDADYFYFETGLEF
jgi:alginate export protein